MAQKVRALPALSKVLSSIPNNYRMAHSHPQWDLMPSSVVKVYVQWSTYMYINILKNLLKN